MLGAIPSGKVNPPIMAAQQDAVPPSGGGDPVPFDFSLATPYPSPDPTNAAVANLQAQLGSGGLGKTFPSTGKDFYSCPLVVLAAVEYTCPTNPLLPGFQPSVKFPDGTVKCTAAGSAKIHLMIKQYMEIAGRLTLPTVDTVLDSSSVASLQIDSILPVGPSSCPIGTTWQNGGCVY